MGEGKMLDSNVIELPTTQVDEMKTEVPDIPEPPRRTCDLDALYRIPEWWVGAARVRREAAEESMAKGFQREADRHSQIATDYERMAERLRRFR